MSTETKNMDCTGTDSEESKNTNFVSSLDDEEPELLNLVSGNGDSFEVSRKGALLSKVVKTALESDQNCEEVPIPGVNSDILKLIVDYMNHHNGTTPKEPEKPLRSIVISEWCKDTYDAKLMEKVVANNQQLYDLILAANYMDMQSLLHTSCAAVASKIKGKPLEKIKDILAVESVN